VRVFGPFTVEAIPVPAVEDVGAPLVGAHAGQAQGLPLPAGAREAEGTSAVIDRRHSEGRVANPAADHIATMIELLREAGGQLSRR
jgi:hypothetical protein